MIQRELPQIQLRYRTRGILEEYLNLSNLGMFLLQRGFAV